MIEVEVVVPNEHGVHARPATKIAQAAAKYTASLIVANGTTEVDAKSVISLMMLAAVQGTTLVIRGDGDDAETAVDEIVSLIKSGFGESD